MYHKNKKLSNREIIFTDEAKKLIESDGNNLSLRVVRDHIGRLDFSWRQSNYEEDCKFIPSEEGHIILKIIDDGVLVDIERN